MHYMYLVFHGREIFFGSSAHRAYPILWNIFEGCSGIYSVIGISLCRIVDVAAKITYVFLHVNLLSIVLFSSSKLFIKHIQSVAGFADLRELRQDLVNGGFLFDLFSDIPLQENLRGYIAKIFRKANELKD